jgi:MFS family permease
VNRIKRFNGADFYSKSFLILHASLSAFIVYTCMYAVRKPYTASSFEGLEQFGISYKVVLVTSQVIGYMLSKFIGIKVISEVQPNSRPKYIIGLIVIGWLALLFFAIVPFQFKFIFLFLNGLPLGMIWGLVFSYLEGRKFTDLMGSLLATSFIISSGIAKTVGRHILSSTNFDQWWMPFITASLFLLPLLIFTYLLSKVPAPTIEDQKERSPRFPMNHKQRGEFIRKYGVLMIAPVVTYMLLTALRDFCEDFSLELWIETKQASTIYLFTQTSTVAGFIVMGLVGLLFLIRNNFKAFQTIHIFVVLGFLLCIVSTYLFQINLLNPISWMICSTTGLYMGYVSCNSIYYERMIASFQIQGNVGFVMYIADAFGYLGTVFVLLIKEYFEWQVNWVSFFTIAFYVASFLGIIFILSSLWGFNRKYQLIQYA